MKTITLLSLVIFSQVALAQKSRVEVKNREKIQTEAREKSVEKRVEVLQKDGKAKYEFQLKQVTDKFMQNYGLNSSQAHVIAALAQKHPLLLRKELAKIDVTIKSMPKESKEVMAAKRQLSLVDLAVKGRSMKDFSPDAVSMILDISAKMAKVEAYFPSLRSTVDQYVLSLREGKSVSVALDNAIDKDNGSYNLKELLSCL